MDMQKSAASRVRHILHAMERSIDSARSRRMTDGSSPDAAGIPVQSTRPPSAADLSRGRPAPAAAPQPRLSIGGTPAGEGRPISSVDGGALIGGNPAAARVQSPPADPTQPARLKAKPKRFEGTFAAQFPQPNQTSYRSQAG